MSDPDPRLLEFKSLIQNAFASNDEAQVADVMRDALLKMAGQPADVLKTLSPGVRNRVEFLREIHKQHDELEIKFFEERDALEAKYQKLYEPLYAKRYEIVNGVVEESNMNEAAEAGFEKHKADEGVPNFWLNAMIANEMLVNEIQLRDKEPLKYLKDIKCYRLDSDKGFKLEFHFDSNPYFSNSVLEKTYHLVGDKKLLLKKAIGTEIHWYIGRNLTQKNRKCLENGKPCLRTENCKSFFNFFNPLHISDDAVNNLDAETLEQIEDQIKHDFEIGTNIRERIIPHAIMWFTRKALEEPDLNYLEDEYDDGR